MTTAKQIIIDGVDVGWCGFYTQGATGMICADWHLSNDCSKNPNCYYKQYKLAEQTVEECHKYQAELEDKLEDKEQECERLKLDLIEAKAHGDYLNNLALSETLNLVSDQLDQLKAENEELKSLLKVRIEDLCDSCGTSSMKLMPCKVYEKTLTKIKDFVQKEIDYFGHDIEYQYDWKELMKLIKINEVEE